MTVSKPDSHLAVISVLTFLHIKSQKKIEMEFILILLMSHHSL